MIKLHSDSQNKFCQKLHKELHTCIWEVLFCCQWSFNFYLFDRHSRCLYLGFFVGRLCAPEDLCSRSGGVWNCKLNSTTISMWPHWLTVCPVYLSALHHVTHFPDWMRSSLWLLFKFQVENPQVNFDSLTTSRRVFHNERHIVVFDFFCVSSRLTIVEFHLSVSVSLPCVIFHIK